MLEVLLSKKDDEDEIKMGVEMELHDKKDYPLLNKMGSRFKRACKAQGVNPNDILNKV